MQRSLQRQYFENAERLYSRTVEQLKNVATRYEYLLSKEAQEASEKFYRELRKIQSPRSYIQEVVEDDFNFFLDRAFEISPDLGELRYIIDDKINEVAESRNVSPDKIKKAFVESDYYIIIQNFDSQGLQDYVDTYDSNPMIDRLSDFLENY